jgi:hypothetical protein
MTNLITEEPETFILQDFQPSYEYSEDEVELTSYPDYLEIKYQNEVIKRVNIPLRLHQRYYVAYKKDLRRKLEVIKPYLSGVESFLVMVADLPGSKQDQVEREVKCEIYRLP